MAESTEISEIEKTIKAKIEEERKRSVSEIIDKSNDAVIRLNNVYTSCMKRLEQLKLVDSDLFKFFWKTKGNIKVTEYKAINSTRLVHNTQDLYNILPDMSLVEGAKYRIIVMVTEAE